MTSRTVVEAARAVRAKECSARELVDEALAFIEQRNPSLNAFAHLDADGARRAADAVDAALAVGNEVGPLAGVPFAVKDLEHCAGMPTTHGSRWYVGGPPQPEDDIHVGRLRAA